MKEFKDYNGTKFLAVAHGNYLCVEKVFGPGRFDFQKHVVLVEDCTDFVFKLMKTKIKANGGASGLLKWLEECENATDFCGGLRSKVYNWIFDDMQPRFKYC